MGGACAKGPVITPRLEDDDTLDTQQRPHHHPITPFEKISSNAVVSYVASEQDTDEVVGKKGRLITTSSRASGNGILHNPLAHTPAGASTDNLIPGTLSQQHTANLSPTGAQNGARSSTKGSQGQVLSVSGRRAVTVTTQTDDEWLDWLAAAAIEGRAPTMPASWRKGGSIGSGSFGTVFLALNNDTGELLAVKEVALGGVSKDQEAVEQLEHEVAVLSSLRHPNIVTYVGTVRQGDTLLIFLEYVPGGSIASLLTRFGPLAEPAIRCFTRQLLDGLAYLHAQRTVHRDIKGANLLVETSGHVKLADFGMAKQMVEAASFTQSFKGSAFWMAPEVIRQQGYGVAADIWSLGCTVLEMATGKPPWAQCTTQVQAIFKIASSGELPNIPQSLSPQASEFILLCLQRDPARRPSAEALLQHPWILQDLDRPGAGMRSGGTPATMSAAPGTWRQVAQAYGQHGRVGAVRRQAPAPHGQVNLSLETASGMISSRPTSSRPTATGGHGAHAQTSGGAHAPSEGEMTDALAAMVLGSNLKRGMTGRRGGGTGGDMGAGADMLSGGGAGDGPTSPSQVEEIDFSAKPSTFKVQGLLTLPPLKILAGGSLPALQLQQTLLHPSTGVVTTLSTSTS